MVGHEHEVKAFDILAEGAKGAHMKAIISPKEGWEGYVMRIVELDPNGHSIKHKHDWPHINYCLDGEGVLFLDGEEHEFKKGSYAYVPSNLEHQYINKSPNSMMRFICIVPEEGHK